MKIGIACNAFKQSGGLERYALDLVRGLNRAGVRPTVFARRFDPDIVRQHDIEPVLVRTGLLPGKWRDQYFSARVAALRRRYGIDRLIGVNRTVCADLAICGGTHIGYLAATNRPPEWSDRRQIALESAQYRHATHIVAHSRMMSDELQRLYDVPSAKIAMVYPPVDTARFTPVRTAADQVQRQAWRRKQGFTDDQIVFLFPSSSHQRKGLALLEAFFLTTTLPVVLAVAGRPIERTSDTVRYVGYQSDMAAAYRAADFTILASRYEPFGLVGVESLLCGTPVVLERRIACTEVLPAAACLSFDSDVAGDLARAIDVAIRVSGSARADRALESHNDEPVVDRVGYDPDIDHHVAGLLSLLETAGEKTGIPQAATAF